MKKILSLILVFSLFLSSCSTLSDIASGAIDDAANSTGISKIGGAADTVKKVVIPKDKKWDDEDSAIREDFVRDMPKAQAYLNGILNTLLSYSKVKDNDFKIYTLRTARVQGLAAWGGYLSGTEVRITRGMFNMIYDEAETACLIGHEIGHVALNHRKENEKPLISNDDKANAVNSVTDAVLGDSKYKGIIKRQQNEILKTNWSRAEEKEADKYGAELAAKAGYDPYAFCDLFERLASRVDLDLIYRFKKIEGSHPALDDRAESLRAYLQKKGYKEGVGKRNRQEYVNGMSELFAMRTGEGKKNAKDLQKGADEESKKDLSRLNDIYEEVSSLSKANRPITMKRFLEIMGEISAISRRYGVTAESVLGAATGSDGKSFMEESIVQDSPFTDMLKSIRDAVAGKVGSILGVLGRVAIGSMPVIGDVIDIYELATGRDFFTGEELTGLERAMTALGLLIGSGQSWRAVAKGLDTELAGLAAKNITEARTALKNAIKDVEVSDTWKRIYSKTANKDFSEISYRKGMSAFEGVAKNDEIFYRVYSKSMDGPFLIKFNPKGMNPTELKKYLALEYQPTHVAKVKVPAGTKIRAGNISGNSWGKGGLTQWEIRTPDGSNITNAGQLKNLKIEFENLGAI